MWNTKLPKPGQVAMVGAKHTRNKLETSERVFRNFQNYNSQKFAKGADSGYRLGRGSVKQPPAGPGTHPLL